jgi:hypothetical protein
VLGFALLWGQPRDGATDSFPLRSAATLEVQHDAAHAIAANRMRSGIGNDSAH